MGQLRFRPIGRLIPVALARVAGLTQHGRAAAALRRCRGNHAIRTSSPKRALCEELVKYVAKCIKVLTCARRCRKPVASLAPLTFSPCAGQGSVSDTP